MRTLQIALVVCFLATLSGCGTTIGNGFVKLDSTPYTNARSLWDAGWPIARSVWSISEFKFCITKLKLTAAGGIPVSHNGQLSIEAVLGMIDVSNESATTTWGEVHLPVEFDLEEMRVEVHKDADKCAGADYSVKYNGTKLNKDLEFRFRFSPTIRLQAGDTLKLGLTNIAIAFEQAAQAGQLTDELIGNYLQNAAGTGVK